MDTPNIICTDRDFTEGARRIQRELLMSPVRSVMAALGDVATLKSGIRYEEKWFQFDLDSFEFGPYDKNRKEQLKLKFEPRKLKTNLGSIYKEFDPNEYAHSIYSSVITKGEALKNTEIVRLALNRAGVKAGDALRRVAFSAKYNPEGSKSVDLFDGYDTISEKEIAAGNLSVANGNLFKFTEAITAENAVDMLTQFADAADDWLQEAEAVNLIVPFSVYNAYCKDYKAVTGAAPYNREFKQTFIEGHENFRLKPMAEKKGSKLIHLTTKQNMLVGVNQSGEEESVIVEKHHPVDLTFFATLFFGEEFRSLNKEHILVGQMVTDDEP